jgi:hypothetical protein
MVSVPLSQKVSPMARSRPALMLMLLAAAVGGGLVVLGSGRTAEAQIFGPPMTVFGSVTDSEGEVPAGLPVEAYVGNKVCGRGETQFTGEGSGRVTVYWADVHSREQTSECGAPGVEVRVKIGERFADQALQWRAGPAQLDVVFGSATPAPIPTFTPTPRNSTPGTPEPPPATFTPTAPGTPTATASASPSLSPSVSPTNTRTATPTATPTLAGGLATREAVTTTNGGGGTSDEGFPVWAAVVIGVGVIVALGGGIGWAMARNRPEEEDE